jgi:CRP/FNR family transcriptional regulator
MKADLIRAFPNFGKALIHELEDHGKIVKLEEGENLEQGDLIDSRVFVLSGSIKMLEQIRGQYFLLYRVKAGESLDLPPSGESEKVFKRFAETASSVLIVPTSVSKSWVCTYPSWRKHLESCYTNTLEKLLDTLWYSGDCLENRILAYLKDLANTHNSQELRITHSEIAEEIGSVREVVSRSLKKLEHHGKLLLKRGRIVMVTEDYQLLS